MTAVEDSVLDEAAKKGISDNHNQNLIQTVNCTLSQVSNEFEKRKSLEKELDGLKDEINHYDDENQSTIEELKGILVLKNEEIGILKLQLVDLEGKKNKFKLN